MAFLELVAALWTLVGAQLSVQHLERPVYFTDLYGVRREAAAALECGPRGRPVLFLAPEANMAMLAHELAHALDCADDGKLNASPIRGERPATRPQWASDYCWNSDAEWYACWVVRSGAVAVSPTASEPRALAPVTPPARHPAGPLERWRPLASALAIFPRR